MITIQLRDYRAIAAADIDVERIAFVQAPNRGGKTSVMWATRAALLGTAAPDRRFLPDQWKKDDLKDLVRGKGPAVCTVQGEDGEGRRWSAKMVWPKGAHETTGQVPRMSAIAAGIWGDTLTNIEIKERAQVLSDLLVSRITFDDFKAAIEVPKTPKGEEILTKLHGDVIKAGFDAVHKSAQEKLAGFKRRWSEITGETFGDVKYQDWRPAGWSADLEQLTPEAAQGAVVAAETIENEAIAGGAVQAERIAQLRTTANALEILKGALEGAEQAEFNAGSAFTDAQRKVGELPPVQDEAMTCPHCNEPVALVAGKLVKSEGKPITAAELKQRRAVRASAEGALSKAENEHKGAIARVAVAKRDVELAEAAAKSLAEIEETAKGIDSEKIARAREAVILAKKNAMLVAQVNDAKRISATIRVSLSVVAALAPTGIRQTVLMREIAAFNERLASISADVGVPTIKFDDTFELWEGERKFKNESGSDQHRIAVVLQIAVAELDGSPMILVDSDVDWDRRFYIGLVRGLLKRKTRALISVRADKIEQALNFANSDSAAVQQLVRCYWIDQDGNALLLKRTEKAA